MPPQQISSPEHLTFAYSYERLAKDFDLRARDDGDIYLPLIRPEEPVDYVFIAMEPSFKWAKTEEAAHELISCGAKSLFDLQLHFSIRRYLCQVGQTYYLTNLSKGAMTVRRAAISRNERYERWYDLLKEEVALVGKTGTKYFAIGKEVERFINRKGFPLLAGGLPHYSRSARPHIRKLVDRESKEFKEFATSIQPKDFAKVAWQVVSSTGMSPDTASIKTEIKFIKRVEKDGLKNSEKELIWIYKSILQNFKQGRPSYRSTD